MANIFDGLQRYADGWAVKSSREFTNEEVSAVRSAHVVESQYGLSVCFFMVGGGQTYIPLSRDSALTAGEEVDLKKARLLTLGKSGSLDIWRVDA